MASFKKIIIAATLCSLMAPSTAYSISGAAVTIMTMGVHSGKSGNRQRSPHDCVEWEYVGNDLWKCHYSPRVKLDKDGNIIPQGIKPEYKCTFTRLSHYQFGYCADGKGKWGTKLDNSGPHPRDSKIRK